MAKAKVLLDGNITAAEKIAIAKITGKSELPVGDHKVDMVIRVQGTIRKADDYSQTPSQSIPTMKALALFVQRMGFQREKALEILQEVIQAAIDGETAPEIDATIVAAEEKVRSMLKELPKRKMTGPTTLVGDLTVTKVAVVDAVKTDIQRPQVKMKKENANKDIHQ